MGVAVASGAVHFAYHFRFIRGLYSHGNFQVGVGSGLGVVVVMDFAQEPKKAVPVTAPSPRISRRENVFFIESPLIWIFVYVH
jgi:hypothetical protein